MLDLRAPAVSLFVIVGVRRRDYVSVRIDLWMAGAAFDIATVGAGGVALAADEPPTLSYAASPGCPSAADFAAAVERRGRHVVVTGESSPAMSVTVDRQSWGGYRGSLRIGPTDREVRGATCDVVVDALAVIAVSALGPDVGLAEDVDASSAPTDGRDNDRPTSEGAPAPHPEAPSPATPSLSPQGQGRPPRAPAAASSPAGGPVRAAPAAVPVSAGTVRFETDNSMTVLGGAMIGLIPSVVIPRFDFTWSRTNLVAMPDGHRYRTFPTVQLYGSVFTQGIYHSRDSSTVSNGAGGGMRLCEPLYYDEVGLQFHLCADLMIGFFGVETTGRGFPPIIRIEGLGTAGLVGDIAYNLGRHFHLGFKIEGVGILGPLTAYASDGSTIFKSSPVGASALLGAGIQF